jgi:hypothetical protein
VTLLKWVGIFLVFRTVTHYLSPCHQVESLVLVHKFLPSKVRSRSSAR